MSEKFNMKIDGNEVTFTEGQTILDVAREAGIYIPTLCAIDGLEPHGGCRLCTIKVIGDRKPYQTACSSPAQNGMEIITNDDELKEMRTEVFQMILSEHPNSCLVCSHRDTCEDLKGDSKEKAGRVLGCFSCPNKEICQLREISEYLEVSELIYDFNYRNLPLERDDPFFVRDYNLCILCGKCVRICSELRGISAINFMSRGHDTKISTGDDVLHIDSSCIFCGGCVDTCPTGALTPKNTRWVKLDNEFVESTCNFCGVGCGFHYYSHNDELSETIPDLSSDINKGQGCVIGRFCGVQFNNGRKRILVPRIKKDPHGLVPCSIDEALEYTKDKLSNYKSDEIAVLASPDLSLESAYLLKKFTDEILNTKNIGTITNNEPVDILFDQLKSINRSFESISSADWIFLINANIQVSHPVLFINLKKAKDKGAKIISSRVGGMELPIETRRFLDEDSMMSRIGLLDKINEISNSGGKGVFIIGQQFRKGILNKVVDICSKNENISAIPLRGRGNIEAVFEMIPKNEKDILQMIEQGKIKALFLTERIDPALVEKVEFTIIQDVFPSKTSDLCEVILPASTFFESTGTFINAERKELKTKSIKHESGKTESDWLLLSKLAFKMNETKRSMFNFTNSENIRNEIKINESIQTNGSNQALDFNDASVIGIPFTPDSFIYRGEKISNQVADLREMIGYRDQLIVEEKKEDLDEPVELKEFEVISNDEVVPNMYRLIVNAPLIAKKAKPGHFLLLMQHEYSERTPLTISDWDREDGTITIYFQERGYTTSELAEAKTGDFIYSVVGPLGNEIEIKEYGTAVLGGGCYGMGAIWPVAKALKAAGNKVIVILESSNEYKIYLREEFEKTVDSVVYVTSDGSIGLKADSKGKIADGIASIVTNEKVDWAYFVGCKVMMMEASEATKELKIPTTVSLNTIMLDGTGMCGACRLTVFEEKGKESTKYACVDGPHFDGHTIKWNELLQRSIQFIDEEINIYRTHSCKALTKFKRDQEVDF